MSVLREFSFSCPSCGKKHKIDTEEAEEYCLDLMDELEKRVSLIEGNIEDYSTTHLFGESRGQMFGALVCIEPYSGQKVVLRAFSGQFNGSWIVPNWAPPIVDVNTFNTAVNKIDPVIKGLTFKIQTLKDSPEKLALIKERKKLSGEHMKEIHSMYIIKNFRGEKTSLFELFKSKKGIPSGTGDCCAPKLINQAINLNLKPLSLAEFFWGRQNISGTRQHRSFYPPCKEKCRPILGFMLCGADS